VGYCGGKGKKPTYQDLIDHTESIQIDYDPKILSTDVLLETFWDCHSPTSRAYSTQYRAALFFSSPEEKAIFTTSKALMQKKTSSTIHTAIIPFTSWTLAEDYHQKYYLRGRRALMSLVTFTDEQIISSSLACYLNAMVSGHCDEKRANEIFVFVQETGNAQLIEAVSKMLGKSNRTVSCGGGW